MRTRTCLYFAVFVNRLYGNWKVGIKGGERGIIEIIMVPCRIFHCTCDSTALGNLYAFRRHHHPSSTHHRDCRRVEIVE